MTSAEFRELALMTSEDFDGRLHTYAIGIKLALEPNLQTCKCMQSGMQDLHWAKLAKLAIPVSRLGLGVQTRNQSFWGLRRLEPLVYIGGLRAALTPKTDILGSAPRVPIGTLGLQVLQVWSSASLAPSW